MTQVLDMKNVEKQVFHLAAFVLMKFLQEHHFPSEESPDGR